MLSENSLRKTDRTGALTLEKEIAIEQQQVNRSRQLISRDCF
jgi:hypothetical protein